MTSGSRAPPNEKGNWSVKEPNSPPGGNVSNAFVRLIVKLLLTLGIAAGMALTKIGTPVFDAGDRLETWARNKRKQL